MPPFTTFEEWLAACPVTLTPDQEDAAADAWLGACEVAAALADEHGCPAVAEAIRAKRPVGG